MNEAAPLNVARVLVVEDSPDDQELLRRELTRTTFSAQFFFAADSKTALDMVQDLASPLKSQLVAILLDLNLPHLSGLDFLKIVRSTEGFKDLPVILMTTSPSAETVEACNQLGVLGIIEKPVRLSKFANTLAQLFHPSSATPLNLS